MKREIKFKVRCTIINKNYALLQSQVSTEYPSTQLQHRFLTFTSHVPPFLQKSVVQTAVGINNYVVSSLDKIVLKFRFLKIFNICPIKQ